jgi:hypothetical protein
VLVDGVPAEDRAVAHWRRAHRRCTVTRMADIDAKAFYWCVKHSRVESGDSVCPGRERLGPYATGSEAQQALQRVQDRNEAWEAEDERWEKGR